MSKATLTLKLSVFYFLKDKIQDKRENSVYNNNMVIRDIIFVRCVDIVKCCKQALTSGPPDDHGQRCVRSV